MNVNEFLDLISLKEIKKIEVIDLSRIKDHDDAKTELKNINKWVNKKGYPFFLQVKKAYFEPVIKFNEANKRYEIEFNLKIESDRKDAITGTEGTK